VKIGLDGSYLRYVVPAAKPWLLGAGSAMVLLALAAIIRDARGTGRPDTGDHGHHHGSRSVPLLLLPVLAILLVAPPALGADSVTRDGDRGTPAVVSRGAAALPPLPAAGVLSMPVTEFITRSVWDTDSLATRTVELTGFVAHQHGRVYLARLVINCCAADATPMKVELLGASTAGLVDDQWIQVTGIPRPGSAVRANGYTPTLAVATLTGVSQPADPYEY
jgi:uncharacterized repeat protein (TIGR03943 family)